MYKIVDMKLTACSKANLHVSVNTSNMCCIISFSKSLLSLGLCPRPLARDGCGQGVWGWPSPTLAHPAHWTESSITQSRVLGGNLSSVSHTYHHPRSLVGILKQNDSPFLAIALMCSVQPCPSEDVHFKCLRKKISIQKIVLFSCNTTYSNQVFERVRDNSVALSLHQPRL